MVDSNVVLQLEAVSLWFERWGNQVVALNAVDLTVRSGEWLMIVGHNGSGKSSLLKCVAGWESPQEGEVQVVGQDVASYGVGDLARKVYFLHQNPVYNSCYKMDLISNLMVAAEGGTTGDMSRKDLRRRCESILKKGKLYDRRYQHPVTLSGGERQLLGLLNAGVQPRVLLLLDEPTSQLDPFNTKECLDEIRRLHAQGMTVIQVSHDLRIATEEGNRTIGMSQGRVVFDQTGPQRNWRQLEDALLQENISLEAEI